ncbi:glutamyl-tRNA synthetase [Rhodomicrobium vannielii ATCC 17100]|uniref:Glutamate--tRNA ligase n=1 Tax=Rhodomicrobium vannielii (strain ATCC 17100 / DSM 162 / LMG 4299 / NCIMB 10020 / ATH 3.1.1) TaxID=648757 RepID=E3I836_RHOVT|nr:glutamate--tRNA ligase [Rhodomicrobium vannielii]ADP71962.1 glutamyl-tRNA synthetase [Rhodomicrobium vannielii ATCC 17100]
MTQVKVRFAPSPTGRLHIGNIRSAVFNWLFARAAGGVFVLRFDDTDLERSKEEYVDGIREDLRWLGLSWDEEFRQSERFAFYAETAEKLKQAGRLYPAYETAAELERRRKLQMARGKPPVYDRAALNLTDAERAQLEAAGRRPHWRFKLDQRPTAWDDLIRGPQEIDAGTISDPVLIREDGTPLYTFTSVADDADTGVTHIIRGEDHVTNTAVQIQLFEALGAAVPRFAHNNLLIGAQGEALSKRIGSLSIAGLREDGFEPLAVMTHAALIGTSEALHPQESLDALASLFDLAKISRAPARFDPAELAGLNAKLLHATPYEAVAERLAARGIDGGEAFWLAVRANLEVFADVDLWWRVANGPITPAIEDAALVEKALALLPPEPWDQTTWKSWTDAVKQATGAKGRALFHPLRLALTGLERGPELKDLLPLIGRREASARLSQG